MARASRAVADQHKIDIERSSSRLFKEYGLHGVTVAQVMADAGLTHGGFYGHFRSKDELAAIACARAFAESGERWSRRIAEANGDGREARRRLMDPISPKTTATTPPTAAPPPRSPATSRASPRTSRFAMSTWPACVRWSTPGAGRCPIPTVLKPTTPRLRKSRYSSVRWRLRALRAAIRFPMPSSRRRAASSSSHDFHALTPHPPARQDHTCSRTPYPAGSTGTAFTTRG